MTCDRCRRPAVISQPYSGNRFCDRHFIRDFERRVKKAVRCSGGIGRGDHLVVALSGGPSSCALVRAFSGFLSGRRDTVLSAVSVNEGSTGRLKVAREIAADLGIGWQADLIKDRPVPAPAPGDIVSELCRLARKSGASKLALGSTVEDCAFRVFSVLSSGVVRKIITEGTDKPEACPGLMILQPLSAIPEDEACLYAELTMGIEFGKTTSGRNPDHISGLRADFNDFCRKHPSTPFALVKLRDELGIPLSPVVPHPGRGTGHSPADVTHPGVYAD